jgi:hypothetical protein
MGHLRGLSGLLGLKKRVLGPEVGEPPGGDDEGSISLANGEDAGNSVRPSCIKLHQHTSLKNPPLASLRRFCF